MSSKVKEDQVGTSDIGGAFSYTQKDTPKVAGDSKERKKKKKLKSFKEFKKDNKK